LFALGLKKANKNTYTRRYT